MSSRVLMKTRSVASRDKAERQKRLSDADITVKTLPRDTPWVEDVRVVCEEGENRFFLGIGAGTASTVRVNGKSIAKKVRYDHTFSISPRAIRADKKPIYECEEGDTVTVASVACRAYVLGGADK